MLINTTEGWQDYQLIDSGEGRKLEKFGGFILDRPDPQIIWKKGNPAIWKAASAVFERTSGDNGIWKQNIPMPDKWQISYNKCKYWIKLTPFKHTGIFPEQAVQWDFIEDKIKNSKQKINLLNLFAYTGAASMIAASCGAKVTHVDASKPAVTWANENRDLSGLKDAPIRWIVDDALEFTEREIKRGVKYEAILMDPPVYGHGPKGGIWEFNRDFPKLLDNCSKLMSDQPSFVLVNAYAISSSCLTLENTLSDFFLDKAASLASGELAIKEKSKGRLLSTGIWASAVW